MKFTAFYCFCLLFLTHFGSFLAVFHSFWPYFTGFNFFKQFLIEFEPFLTVFDPFWTAFDSFWLFLKVFYALFYCFCYISVIFKDFTVRLLHHLSWCLFSFPIFFSFHFILIILDLSFFINFPTYFGSFFFSFFTIFIFQFSKWSQNGAKKRDPGEK